MVGVAERVGDAVLAAMADDDDVRVRERRRALRAATQAVTGVRVDAREAPGVPVRALDDPRDDVLQTAEDGEPLAGRFSRAKALVLVDSDPAPAARKAHAGKGTCGRGRDSLDPLWQTR